MARAIVVTKQLAASSANNIAQSQTPVSGTALTLNGSTVTAGVATLDTPRRLSLAYGNEGSARTLVISGTMDGGNPITETLKIPSGGAGSPIATLQDFLTVTSAVPAGGGWSAAVTLGTNATGSTRWILVNNQQQVQNIGVECVLESGAATWTIETSQDSPLAAIPIYQAGYSQANGIPTAFGAAGLTGLTGNTQGDITGSIACMRLTITAGTGLVQTTFLPAGISD
jgi:hypothetical protein